MVSEVATEPRNMERVILRAEGVTKTFEGVFALNSVDISVRQAEILGLIGPNGSGKTTLFNVLTGVVAASAGRVIHRGFDITNWPTHRIAARGVIRTFQIPRMFPNASTLENVLVGTHLTGEIAFWKIIAGMRKVRELECAARERAWSSLKIVGLAGEANTIARTLSYGAVKRVEIARALCAEPEVLLLDEPAAGLNPAESDELLQVISKLRGDGKAIVLIEHDMRLVMGVCDRIVVLDAGSRIAEGSACSIKADPRVREVYLGKRGS